MCILAGGWFLPGGLTRSGTYPTLSGRNQFGNALLLLDHLFLLLLPQPVTFIRVCQPFNRIKLEHFDAVKLQRKKIPCLSWISIVWQYETAPYWLNWLNFYRTQVRSLPCFVSHILLVFNFAQVVGFVKVFRWISLSCEMDFSKLINWFYKLLHEFVEVVLRIPRPLPNITKLKFDKYFKACWSFCFDLKVNEYSMPWVL